MERESPIQPQLPQEPTRSGRSAPHDEINHEQHLFPRLARAKTKRPTPIEIGTFYAAGGNEDRPFISQPGSASFDPTTRANDIYLGSYASARNVLHPRTPTNVSFNQPENSQSLNPHPAGLSPRASLSHAQLSHLLPTSAEELDDFGLAERRDGFFDAKFLSSHSRPRFSLPLRHDDGHEVSGASAVSQKVSHNFAPREIFPSLLESIRAYIAKNEGTNTRHILQLLKSFLGVWIAFVICSIPILQAWLGPYNYILALSGIINHPGRSVGSQIEGTLLVIAGSFSGLAWSALALWTSKSTQPAQQGYGGILATFLVIFTLVLGWLRCALPRLYQFVISAGIALYYACLADAGMQNGWQKFRDYGVPLILGQALSLFVCIIIYPSSGVHDLGAALHETLFIIRQALEKPQVASAPLNRSLTLHIAKLSTAVRDFTMEFTISRFDPSDLPILRNHLQRVMRCLLGINAATTPFHASGPITDDRSEGITARACLSESISSLLTAMDSAVTTIDRALHSMTDFCGASTQNIAERLREVQNDLAHSIQTSQIALDTYFQESSPSATRSKSSAMLESLLHTEQTRQMADQISALLEHTMAMYGKSTIWRPRFPSYPWRKALLRSNAQVRHDRGGVTAGFYFRSKNQLDRTMADLRGRSFVPTSRKASRRQSVKLSQKGSRYLSKDGNSEMVGSDQKSVPGQGILAQMTATWQTLTSSLKHSLRRRIWTIVHRLQGFESRFAFKVAIVTTLLSIPAWLVQSRGWWNTNSMWWTVMAAWLMMHPRVGGTLKDLIVRCTCACISAIWAGFACAAAGGNRIVLAVFAAVFLIPMMYRFTQSSHPRSGIISCITFVFIALDVNSSNNRASITQQVWTRGLGIIVGIVAAVSVNWVLWPFVARHELRKSTSSMMMHMSVLHRNILGRYVYHFEGDAPGPEDVARSEVIEGHIREGFVRLRQLLALTQHELRLRGPFDSRPYGDLIIACEAFFERLVQIRQASIGFHPHLPKKSRDDVQSMESLVTVRRDAVAVVLLNLYCLACALRSDQPIPKYLPNAALARHRLIEQMDAVETELDLTNVASDNEPHTSTISAAHKTGLRRRVHEAQKEIVDNRRTDVYYFAFSKALTGILDELQTLTACTQHICGESRWA